MTWVLMVVDYKACTTDSILNFA